MVASWQTWREGLPWWVGKLVFLIGLLVVIWFPTGVSESGDALNTATLALAYIVMALGLNIVVGFAGLLDLGYLAFYAIGAYCVGWFGSGFYAQNNVHFLSTKFASLLPGIHLWWPVIVLIAIVLCAIAGVLIGLPTLRLRGDYIAIVTLGFGEIIRVFAQNGDEIHIFGHQLTNGRQGITATDAIGFPGHQGFSQLDLRPWYWVALGMVLITLYVNFRVRDSRLGRAWIAIREDEVAAASMGVPLVRTKLMAYATGAALGGMAGAFLGSYLTNVTSDSFQFSFSILILAMVILGGLGSIWGVVLGAIALTYINYELLPNQLNDLPGKFGLNFALTDVQIAIYGALLVIIMVLRPQGLLPERGHRMELAEGIGAGDAMAAEGIIEEPV
jgi:branched-chain amino acid transport system permease protein